MVRGREELWIAAAAGGSVTGGLQPGGLGRVGARGLRSPVRSRRCPLPEVLSLCQADQFALIPLFPNFSSCHQHPVTIMPCPPAKPCLLPQPPPMFCGRPQVGLLPWPRPHGGVRRAFFDPSPPCDKRGYL